MEDGDHCDRADRWSDQACLARSQRTGPRGNSMSLLSSIQLAGNSLQATRSACKSPGRILPTRTRPATSAKPSNYTAGPGVTVGNVVEGTGVEVSGITQQIDTFIQQELRNANSAAAGTAVQQQTYQQLEGLMNELGDTGINTDLTNFFSSISNVLNSPTDVATRNLAVLQGQTLSGDINQLAQQVQQSREDLNAQVTSSASDINSLISQIATLNTQIANTTGGNPNSSAVGLTDEQDQALTNLSNLISINVQTQANGEVSVYAGGDYLVYNDETHQVSATQSTNRGITVQRADRRRQQLAFGVGQRSGGRAGELARHDPGGLSRPTEYLCRHVGQRVQQGLCVGTGAHRLPNRDQRARRRRSHTAAGCHGAAVYACQRFVPDPGLQYRHRPDANQQYQRQSERPGRRHLAPGRCRAAQPGQRSVGYDQ